MRALVFGDKSLQRSYCYGPLKFIAASKFAQIAYRTNKGASSRQNISVSDSLYGASEIFLGNLANEFYYIIGGGTSLPTRRVRATEAS